jgi:DNA-binding LytR/AlgR family response regulator
MTRLRTLLLHPESDVRAGLRQMLRGVDFIKVLGEAVSAFEAMELLESIPYSLFFVSVELPDGVSGLELAQMLYKRKDKPAMVFIARDESMAYRAFELGALDYLLTPVTEQRLAGTVERLRQLKPGFRQAAAPLAWREQASHGPDDEAEEMVKLPLEDEETEDRFISALRQAWDFKEREKPLDMEKLPIGLEGRTIFLSYAEIVFVEANEDYSYIHTASQKYLTSYRVKNLEDRLRPHRFFRVHRKYLVNLDMVTEIASLPGSNFMLRTAGKTRLELPVGRRRVAELKQILGL